MARPFYARLYLLAKSMRDGPPRRAGGAVDPGKNRQNGAVDRALADLSKTIDPVLLGRRIRAARVAAGLTQTELSKGLASAAYFSRIESGDRRPDAPLLESIAAKLHVPLEELLSGVSRDQVAEWELERDYAELALQSGDWTDALKRSAALLAADGIEQVQSLHPRSGEFMPSLLRPAATWTGRSTRWKAWSTRNPTTSRGCVI